MSGMLILNLSGAAFRVLIRAPYTHNKSKFSMMRCFVIYFRMFLLINIFNPDFGSKCEYLNILNIVKEFFFPYYCLLSSLDEENQQSFWILMLIHLINMATFIVTRYIYKGTIKLKISFYLMEIVLPDIFIYLVYNFLTLSPFDCYSKTLGFFITFSLYVSVCIGAPIIHIVDREEYRTGIIMQTGLKSTRKEWHYVLKIQELVIVMTNFFCALWMQDKEISKQVLFGIVIFIFMRLQKTYWPFLFREDNLFMENCYLVLLALNFVGYSYYNIFVLFLPGLSYLSLYRKKVD